MAKSPDAFRTLIGGIKKLLHEDGMTIKGARKLLKEKGVKYVASLSRPLDTPLSEIPEISGITIEGTKVMEAVEAARAARREAGEEAQGALRQKMQQPNPPPKPHLNPPQKRHR